MVEGDVGRDGPAFRLEHHRLLGSSDPSQQVELLVHKRAAGRVVPELQIPAVHFTNAIREMEPDIPGKRIGREGGRVDVEHRVHSRSGT